MGLVAVALDRQAQRRPREVELGHKPPAVAHLVMPLWLWQPARRQQRQDHQLELTVEHSVMPHPLLDRLAQPRCCPTTWATQDLDAPPQSPETEPEPEGLLEDPTQTPI